MVIYPPLAGLRALLLAVLLGVSIASKAQSTGSDTDTDSSAEASASWSSDLKAPLRPADNVGGSWNASLLYGQMTDAALVDVFVFSFDWEEAKLLTGEVGYTLKESNPMVQFLDPVLSSIDVATNVTYQDDPA
ncbi:MAG: hypothetical protein GWP74_10220, partial [Proteobacteria bacterium]|nr:hypothetical protein [Pseudomonadota bacterium]